MEIEKIASAAVAGQASPNVAQSVGAQDSQIAELQRLADSIRKMENDFRITARVQGVSGSGVQTKLRQYDELLSKVNEQIRQLERQNRQAENATDSSKNKYIGVSMLQYNTDAAQVAMRNSGQSVRAVVSDTMDAQLAKAQANAAARKAEQKAQADIQKEQSKVERTQKDDETPSLDVLA